MDLGLKGKNVVVTGGSKGIGYAIAEEFLKEGARVTISARGEEDLNKAIEELSKLGDIRGVVADSSIEADNLRLGQVAAEGIGYIDSWVNNVGANKLRKGELYTEEEVDFLIGANFKSAVFGTQTAFTYMKERGGSIVNIASLAARTASAGTATIYGAMKAAVVGLTNNTAGEYAAYHIRVNAILPGWTKTDFTSGITTDPDREYIRKQAELKGLSGNLMKRYATPTEVAKPAVFLASDAASFITAESLEVTAGHFKVLNPDYSFENKK